MNDDLTLNDYQTQALRTANRLPKLQLSSEDAAILRAVIGLAGEAGEALEIVKKWLFHDTPLDMVALKKELGDAGWYWAAAADSVGMQLSQIAWQNIQKLSARYPEGFTAERSQLRCKCSHHHDDHADDTVFLESTHFVNGVETGSSITTFACTQCPCGDYDGPDGGSA